MENGRQRKIGIIISYINLLISNLIPFFYTPIMLDILGQNEYGLYSLAQSVISYLGLLNFGLTSTSIRYINKYKNENNKEGIENIMALFIMIFLFLAIIIMLLSFIISGFSGQIFGKGLTVIEIDKLKTLIILLASSIPIAFVSGVFTSVVICHERFIFKYIFDCLLSIAAPILNLVALYSGFATAGMALSGLLLQLVSLPIYVYYCKKKFNIFPNFKNIPYNMLREVTSFSTILFVSSLADLLFWATDKVLIGAFLGSTYVAIYNIGNTFTNMFQNMSSVISGVFSPQANALVFKNESITESSKLMIKIGRIQYLIISLILSGFVVFGQDFIFYWAGPEYSQAYIIALVTMVPLTIPLIENIAFNTLLAMGKHLFRAKMYIFISVINVIFTYLILPYYGILGAAICTGISYVVGQGVILNIYYYKVIGLDIPKFWRNVFKMSIVPICMIIISIFLFNKIIFINDLKVLLFWIIVYTIIYCVLTWIFTMNSYEKDLIKDIFRKIIKI